MSLLLLALAAAQALLPRADAAVPIRLPPQERAADWQEALSIAGLSVGAPGEGAWVDVVVGPGTWTLRVRDLSGALHDASVPPPRTEQEREDVAMLAASLLQPVVVPTRPKAPVEAPPPVRTTPRVAVVTPPPPAPVPLPPEPEPTPVAPAEVTPPAAPAPEPPTPAFQGRIGLAGEARWWATPTGLVWGEVQLVGASPLRPAIGAALVAPADLPRITDDVLFWSGEVWLGAWYAAPAPLRFDFGLTAGMAARTFLKDDLPAGVAWLPVLSTRLEVPIQVAPGLLLEPGVHLLVDAREVYLHTDEEGTNRFADWGVRVAVAIRPVPKIPPNP